MKGQGLNKEADVLVLWISEAGACLQLATLLEEISF